MNTATTSKGHPKGLYLLFVTEMWERFSYYGMRAIFILYMGKALLFDKTLSSQIYGSYTGLVYLTPLIGGYMADRYWGNRKSIILGGLLMAVGQFLMFLSASMYTNIPFASTIMYLALIFMIFGNGFFKPNISTMVGQLYPKGDKRIDTAFTIFYMGINLGAFFAPLVCGGLAGEDPANFRWGFFAAGAGMLLSVLIFVWLKNFYLITPDNEQIGVAANVKRETVEIDTPAEVKANYKPSTFIIWGVVALALFEILLIGFDSGNFSRFLSSPLKYSHHTMGMDFDLIGSIIFSLAVAIPGLIISDPSLNKIEKQRIWVIYVACFFVIFFWSAFEQAGASLTFFAEEKTDRHLGLKISQIMARVLVFLVTCLLAWIGFRSYKKMNSEKPGLRGIVTALFVVVIVYCIYALITMGNGGLDLTDIPAAYFQSINAVAIVIFAPLFALLWTKLGQRNMEPASPFKQAMGLFLLAIGYLVIAYGVKGIAPGVKTSMLWLVALYTIHTFGELCLSPIGLSMVNKLAPVKLASLLMGVWFLANATANKFAGTLSALYPEQMVPMTVVQEVNTKYNSNILKKNAAPEEFKGDSCYTMEMLNLSVIKDKDVKTQVVTLIETKGLSKEKAFAGFKIQNLYDFFMIFVFMAGIASIILFFIARYLVKMMHGVR